MKSEKGNFKRLNNVQNLIIVLIVRKMSFLKNLQ
jgi:hypothetical protein